MAIPRAVLALATLLTLATSVSFSQKPEFAKCSGREVTYEPFDQQFAAKMTFQPCANAPLVKGGKQLSPQHTRYLVLSKPDFRKPGPWDTVVWIRDTAGKATPVMLTFTNIVAAASAFIG
jgi:hypothetical protein